MKIPASRGRRGFTLVELLVVISIIAVLAAAGFTAGKAAIEKAKRMTALATCTAIETAVNNYFTEYGSLPFIDEGDDGKEAEPIDTKTDKDFLEVLLGMESTETGTNPLNTRGINFLSSVKEGKKRGATDGKDGLVYSDDRKSIIGLFDPWGYPYFVQLDTNYDEEIDVKPDGTMKIKTLNRKVAVWSNGADWKDDNKPRDDVKTW